MGCGELWKVPTEPHFVEAAQVVLARLKGFEFSKALHVVQQCAQWIGTPHFFARLHVVTGHLVPFVQLFEALADLFVLPPPKSASMQQAKLRWLVFHSSLESLLSSSGRVVYGLVSTVFLLGGLLHLHLELRGATATFTPRLLSLMAGYFQLSDHWSHPVASHSLLVHPCHLSLHPCHLSFHPHHLSLHLPHCLCCHLPGIQCQPRCGSLSQRLGLILSGSLASRCWKQNSIGIHFAGAAERGFWTWNETKMKSTSGSRALLNRQSGLARLTCQNCCHLLFPHGQAAPVSMSVCGRPWHPC